MGAEFIDQTEPALRVAKGQEPLRQQLHPDRRALGLGQFLRQQERNPIATQQIADRGSGARPGQQFVLLAGQHLASFSFARRTKSNPSRRGARRLPSRVASERPGNRSELRALLLDRASEQSRVARAFAPALRRPGHSGINANVHSEPPVGTWPAAKRGMTAPPNPDAIDTNCRPLWV